MMNASWKEINNYCHAFTSPPPELLSSLDRETHLKTLAPQMLSGSLQGRFLSMLCHMIRPNVILEIGTFTGYATLCMAEGLKENGKIYTIDANEELAYISRKYFDQSIHAPKIIPIVENALNTLAHWSFEMIDILFIDAAKTQYADYYDLAFDHIKSGGYIFADNVLWSGKVMLEDKDTDTQSIANFNQKINDDPRVEQVLVPIRDGIMLARKK